MQERSDTLQLEHPGLQCPVCEYPIHDPEASRCSECGVAIDSAELARRQSLPLAWEREISHSPARLTLALRTIVAVWLRPWLPFRNRTASDRFHEPFWFMKFGLLVSFLFVNSLFLLWRLADIASQYRYFPFKRAFELATLGGIEFWLLIILNSFAANILSALIATILVLVVIRARINRRGEKMVFATPIALMAPSIFLTGISQTVAGLAFSVLSILRFGRDLIPAIGFAVVGHFLFSIWRCAMVYTGQSKWVSAYLVVISAIAIFVARMLMTKVMPVITV